MTLAIWFLSFFLAVAPAPVHTSARALTVPPSLIPSYMGFWLMEDEDVVVEISRQGDAYVGRLAGFRKDPTNAQKKSRLNTYLFKDLKPDDNNLVGKVIDPKSGKEYKAFLILTGPNSLEMRVKAMGVTAHTESWTRVTSPK